MTTSVLKDLFCEICQLQFVKKSAFGMGTLKSVCTSWFGLVSRDKYEHTHLRLWIHNSIVHKNLFCELCQLQFVKRYEFDIHNSFVHEIN